MARRVTVLAALVALVVVVFRLGHTVHSVWVPDGFPTWDASIYLMEAVRLRQVMESGDGERILRALTKPDLHPPLHALLIAGWMKIFGGSMAVARSYGFAGFVAGLLLLVWTGRGLGGRAGLLAGLGAAALSACGFGSLTLLLTPMTEASALPATLLFLGAALRLADRPGWGGALVLGALALAGALIRYNLLPMLLAPLGGWFFLRHLRQPRAWLDLRPVLWGLPALIAFVAWQLHRPELLGNIQKFLENRSSGIPFWSVENLAWVPIQTNAEFLDAPPLVAALFLLFALGLLPRRLQAWREPGEEEWGLRILQAYVLVSFAALTWHDFKIARNLGGVLPVFHLCALYPFFAGLRRLPSLGPALFSVTMLLLLPWQQTHKFAELRSRSDFQANPAVRGALDLIARNAAGQAQIWVTGCVFRLPPDLVFFWLDQAGIKAKVRMEQPLLGEQTRTGVDIGWKEGYRDEVEKMVSAHPDTTFIAIETTPGTRFFDDWKAFGNHYARALAEREDLTEIDRIQYVDDGLSVRVFRRGGTPAAAALATGPRPDDEVGIRPLPGAPIWRESFAAPAPLWRVYPPWAVSKVQIERQPSALQVTAPAVEKNLQICSDLLDKPADAAVALVHLHSTGLTGAKAWLHVRGMSADGKLQDRDGQPDISMAGPLLSDGEGRWSFDVRLGPASPKMRLCAVLDGNQGSLRLDDWALYPAGTKDTPPAAAAVVPSGGEADWMETFDKPSGWAVVPPDGLATLSLEAGTLRIAVEAEQAHLQVCGKPFPWSGARSGAVTVRTEGVQGKGWVHFRPLDAEGKLVKDSTGVAPIAQAGPLTGDDRRTWALRLDWPAEAAQVRPCVVLDQLRGTVVVEDAALAP